MNFIRLAVFLSVCLCGSVSAEASKDFLAGKTKVEGYFSFYHEEATGKVFLEIDKFKQPFLFQSSLPKGVGSNDIGLDRGQLGNTRLVQFERVGNKVLLRELNTYYRADSDNELEKAAVEEAFASSIIWGFKVANVYEENKQVTDAVVSVDYTDFLLSDIHNLAASLKRKKQGTFSIDKARSAFFEERSKAFPKNTELEAIVTFKGQGTGSYLRSVAPDANAITVNLHHSLIELPDDGYAPREFHPYSGFWAQSYADYATKIDQPLVQRVIPRHRLKKKDPNAAMSEAVNPIVYYLDAGVPEPVKGALLDGARWWNEAFEAIGYKNAYQVKMLPADADPMDVRYNVIQWVHRATRGWSYGSSVIDPRTGEIIKGHVTLGSLRVRQDYLIALGLTSPFSKENVDTSPMKEMALARIRQLSAHEVGHTLGIAHNFAASVNNRASVMDYPHPLITLDDDGEISLDGAYGVGLGDWDKYVVAYGYSELNPNEEKQALANLVTTAQKAGLQYMSDPDARAKSSAHVTGHLWDNGENAALELERVLKIRKKALENFGLNSIEVGTPYSELETSLVPIYNFHRFQVEAAAKLIAGIEYSYQVKELADINRQENSSAVSSVSPEMQRQAIVALLKTLDPKTLDIPEHILRLIPPKAYGYSRTRESFVGNTGLTFDPISAGEASAKHTLTLLLNNERLARLQQQAMTVYGIPSVNELINELLMNTVKSKANKGLQLLLQQRVNQQVVEHLLKLWHQENVVPEVRAEVLVALSDLSEWLDDNKSSRKYRPLSAHFHLLENQIEHSLSEGKRFLPETKAKLPPGSPIGG